ncbi:hypothetical protein BLOT_009460 [Blomia tropicalis]|nr:hypothetical protein BLOT_009460 [Blomia tropicalis]
MPKKSLVWCQSYLSTAQFICMPSIVLISCHIICELTLEFSSQHKTNFGQLRHAYLSFRYFCGVDMKTQETKLHGVETFFHAGSQVLLHFDVIRKESSSFGSVAFQVYKPIERGDQKLMIENSPLGVLGW